MHLIFYTSLILLEAKNTETCFRLICLTSDKSAVIKYGCPLEFSERCFFLDVHWVITREDEKSSGFLKDAPLISYILNSHFHAPWLLLSWRSQCYLDFCLSLMNQHFLAKFSFMFWLNTNIEVLSNIGMSVFVMVYNGPRLMQMGHF